jgi:hypothetical protein
LGSFAQVKFKSIGHYLWAQAEKKIFAGNQAQKRENLDGLAGNRGQAMNLLAKSYNLGSALRGNSPLVLASVMAGHNPREAGKVTGSCSAPSDHECNAFVSNDS